MVTVGAKIKNAKNAICMKNRAAENRPCDSFGDILVTRFLAILLKLVGMYECKEKKLKTIFI